MDLEDSKQRAAACQRLERALTSTSVGVPLLDVLAKMEKRIADGGDPTGALLKCADELRGAVAVYTYPSLESWWDSTSYVDVIDDEDQVFRDKPINLKRIVLEAFNAARRAEVIDMGA